MGQKLSNIHWLVDKTMNMCESYLTKTYLKISGVLPGFLEILWLFGKVGWKGGISVYFYSELHNAIMSYSRVQFLLTKVGRG